MKRAIRLSNPSNGSSPVNLKFHLNYLLSRLFPVLPDCADPLFHFALCSYLKNPSSTLLISFDLSFLVRCRHAFCKYLIFLNYDWNLIFPLDLSSVPETFVYLFLVSDFILQHLVLFVNSFLKIYLLFLYCWIYQRYPSPSDCGPADISYNAPAVLRSHPATSSSRAVTFATAGHVRRGKCCRIWF